MKSVIGLSAALALTALPAAALAQVTQTYQYDANGRLTGVTTSGGGGVHSSVYAYDDANNRTYRSQTGTTAYAALLRDLGDLLRESPAFAAAAADLEKAAAGLMLSRPEDPSVVAAIPAPGAAGQWSDPAGLRSFQGLTPADVPAR